MAPKQPKLTPEQEAAARQAIEVGGKVVGAARNVVEPIVDLFDGADPPSPTLVTGLGASVAAILKMDSDHDGITDVREQKLGTDPTKKDSDGDGINDARELKLGSDPTKKDTDYDGVNDLDEQKLGTDPKKKDSDGDGLTDGQERKLGTDAKKADTDDDGLTDAEERKLGTNATDNDTDRDGLGDAYEVGVGTNPLAADSDGDGLGDQWEISGSDPNDRDSDDDGLEDGNERMVGTDPLKADTDGDGVSDLDEVERNSDPLDPAAVPGTATDDPAPAPGPVTAPSSTLSDSPAGQNARVSTGGLDDDGDRMPDRLEPIAGGDGSRPDTDLDGVRDDDEWIWKGSGAYKRDTDGDGLTDAAEHRLGTAVDRNDTDGDGISDLMEVRIGTDPTVSNRQGGDPFPNPTTDDQLLRNLDARITVTRQVMEAVDPMPTEVDDATGGAFEPIAEPEPFDMEPPSSVTFPDGDGESMDPGSMEDDRGVSMDVDDFAQ